MFNRQNQVTLRSLRANLPCKFNGGKHLLFHFSLSFLADKLVELHPNNGAEEVHDLFIDHTEPNVELLLEFSPIVDQVSACIVYFARVRDFLQPKLGLNLESPESVTCLISDRLRNKLLSVDLVLSITQCFKGWVL